MSQIKMIPRFKVRVHRADDTEETILCNTAEALGALILTVNGQVEVFDMLTRRAVLVEITGGDQHE